jgi:hypothetical protein
VVVANLLGKLLRPSKLREEQNGLNTVELNIVNNETTLVVSCTQDGTDTGRTTDGEPATAHAGARRAGARHAGARRAGARRAGARLAGAPHRGGNTAIPHRLPTHLSSYGTDEHKTTGITQPLQG